MASETTLAPGKVLDGYGKIGLRAVDAPMADVTRTWAMDIPHSDLPLPKPAGPCTISGFWNDVPEEEQRPVIELMPPTYRRKSPPPPHGTSGMDMMELAYMLIGIYLLLALVHMVMLIGRI